MVESRYPIGGLVQLARALALLIGASWRVLGLVLLCIIVARWAFDHAGPIAQSRMKTNDTSSIAVYEQARRASTIGDVDLLLIGDSACLMGVDSQLLSRLTGLRAASLCSIGYVGPAGYATMLRRYDAAGFTAGRILLMIHAAEFGRAPGWSYWESFVADPDGALTPNYRDRGELFLERSVVAPFLRLPLDGAWGVYYGGLEHYRSAVASAGSAVDPLTGFSHPCRQGELAMAPAAGRDSAEISLEITSLFESALDQLAGYIREAGPDKFYLSVAPLPDREFSPQTAALDRAGRAMIERRLDLPRGHVLASPEMMPGVLFSSGTHLNRCGKIAFTRALAQAIGALDAPRP